MAADHDETVRGRAAELAAIAEAKMILGGSTADLFTLLRRLAQEHRSTVLTQLVSRVSAVLELGASGGDDVFAKVKGLIQDMIDKLLEDAAAEATEKAAGTKLM